MLCPLTGSHKTTGGCWEWLDLWNNTGRKKHNLNVHQKSIPQPPKWKQIVLCVYIYISIIIHRSWLIYCSFCGYFHKTTEMSHTTWPLVSLNLRPSLQTWGRCSQRPSRSSTTDRSVAAPAPPLLWTFRPVGGYDWGTSRSSRSDVGNWQRCQSQRTGKDLIPALWLSLPKFDPKMVPTRVEREI